MHIFINQIDIAMILRQNQTADEKNTMVISCTDGNQNLKLQGKAYQSLSL